MMVDPCEGDPSLAILVRAIHWLECRRLRQDHPVQGKKTVDGDALLAAASNLRFKGAECFGSLPVDTLRARQERRRDGDVDPDHPLSTGRRLEKGDEDAGEWVMRCVWAALRRGDLPWARAVCQLNVSCVLLEGADGPAGALAVGAAGTVFALLPVPRGDGPITDAAQLPSR